MSTRNAAAAATSNVEQIPAVDDSESESVNDAENASSFEEESDYESGSRTSEKGAPRKKAKRAKHSVAPRKKAAAPTKRGKKSLSLLPSMPLDVLFEILGQLTPKDLLNVVRVNRVFRETLLARSGKSVWIRALEHAGAPKCPSDWMEPRWARLLFRTSCEVKNCGASNIQRVDFLLRRRVCAACKRNHLIAKCKVALVFPDLDPLVLSLIPSTKASGWSPDPDNQDKVFWRPDIEEMRCTIAKYKKKKKAGKPGAENEMATFVAQRIAIVEEMQSREEELNSWLSNFAIARQEETQQSMKRRQDAIRAKFLELGYEEDDLSDLQKEKAYNQKAALSDNIWKRIHPILEPNVKAAKERRIAIQMRPIKRTRRNLLDHLCKMHKDTISSALWKYVPAAIELGRKEPFKALIDAEPDVTPTIGDFLPHLSKLPALIVEVQNELKDNLTQKLAATSKKDDPLPANYLDLATAVFRCNAPTCVSNKTYVVGTESIFSHNCGVDTSLYNLGYNFGVDWAAANTAKALVVCAGLDPEKALASEMDSKDLRFACEYCSRHLGYSWRTALSHAKEHKQHIRRPFGVLEVRFLNSWRVLSPAEATCVRAKEEKDPKWKEPRWSCSHCAIALRKEALHRNPVFRHVQRVHKIESPTVPADLFYFEKVVTPFRQQDKLTYKSSTN